MTSNAHGFVSGTEDQRTGCYRHETALMTRRWRGGCLDDPGRAAIAGPARTGRLLTPAGPRSYVAGDDRGSDGHDVGTEGGSEFSSREMLARLVAFPTVSSSSNLDCIVFIRD